ncbi:hypothetical protein F383_22080 [Gossypium arboreum]|uniref:Uncharacterized protein n=1 Tax=Gossypium arboreum TaxID=29729 RepID=A0A0B0MKN9_GOSAR|nr:hypothetical protein F383_22080 [Gossypium arboreum]
MPSQDGRRQEYNQPTLSQKQIASYMNLLEVVGRRGSSGTSALCCLVNDICSPQNHIPTTCTPLNSYTDR